LIDDIRKRQVTRNYTNTALKILEVASEKIGQSIIDDLDATIGTIGEASRVTLPKRQIDEISISDDESAGYVSESLTYILKSGRIAEKVAREFYKKDTFGLHILELSTDDLSDSSLLGDLPSDDLLSDDDRYGFTAPEWAQIRADFQALLSPLECKISEPYMQALSFLCQRTYSESLDQTDKGFDFMMQEIGVTSNESNLIDDGLHSSLRNLHILVSLTAAMFHSEQELADTDSEGSFVIRYFANNMESIFSELRKDVKLKWGETWQFASTSRRNGDNVQGKRVRPGQKVDLII